jgi:transposase
MDERLQAILDSVQKTADTAAETAQDMGKRATQWLSAGKLNIRIMDLKNQVSEKLREVGQMVYSTHTGSPTDSESLLQKLREIDQLNAQIQALTAEMQQGKEPQGAVVCPICGALARKNDKFCRSCGAKL